MSLSDIIAKVKEHPELWQSAHPFYRHRFVSAKTWKQIAAELRLDDWVQIKKRWKHMKDTFRKEIKKMTTNQIVSAWIHYPELEFLTEEITKKQVVPESDVSETEESNKESVTTKRIKKRKRLEPIAQVEMTSQNLKFKKIIRSLNTLCKHVGKSTDFIDDELKNDTDYMFLVSLLPTMKNLSDIQRLHFRGKINNWLLNALMENEANAHINDPTITECKIEIEDDK